LETSTPGPARLTSLNSEAARESVDSSEMCNLPAFPVHHRFFYRDGWSFHQLIFISTRERCLLLLLQPWYVEN
jgi:hypothetical protein